MDTVDKVREWAKGKEAEMLQPQLEEMFGTPDSLRAFRLILALCDVVECHIETLKEHEEMGECDALVALDEKAKEVVE